MSTFGQKRKQDKRGNKQDKRGNKKDKRGNKQDKRGNRTKEETGYCMPPHT
jgi:hypothetical protein